MKKSELQQIIKEEISKVLNEALTTPSSYNYENPGSEWEAIFAKAIERYSKHSGSKKVQKDLLDLFTHVYKLAEKSSGIKLAYVPAAIARAVIDQGARRRSGKLPIQGDIKGLIAYIKKDFDPNNTPNWTDPQTDKMVKSKKWLRITPQTKLKVGDDIVNMRSLIFATINKIDGNKYYVEFDMDYADDKPTRIPKDTLENFFLLKKK
jgi:hypothetical protein